MFRRYWFARPTDIFSSIVSIFESFESSYVIKKIDNSIHTNGMLFNVHSKKKLKEKGFQSFA